MRQRSIKGWSEPLLITGLQARGSPSEAWAGVATSSEITETSERMLVLKENLLRLIQAEKESLLAGQATG